MTNSITLYAVKNQEGKYFRAKGYGGGGDSWVDSLEKAKLYTKIGQARSRVSYFVNNWPEYGVPDIIKLTAVETETLNEIDRVNKQIKRKKSEKARHILRRKKIEFSRAQKMLELAQSNYQKKKLEIGRD